MVNENLVIKGARQHNLKNIDVVIPRDKLVVLTGLSGSGKSSLAFDTIYAEGQRRYVESLSAYARQFLGQMDKPDVDYIEGLSPAISIDQKTTSKNPRSTVGTVTEIHDYLRLLFARVGKPHCPECGKPITMQTIDQMVDSILTLEVGTKILVLAPLIRSRKGEYVKLFEEVRKEGFVRVRVDGEVRTLDEDIKLDKQKKHTIEIVVDRLVIKPDLGKRLAESLEVALQKGEGRANILELGEVEKLHSYNQNFSCADCGISIEELTPRMFSFNNPYGACPLCSGLGKLMTIDEDMLIPDRTRSIRGGALYNWTGYTTNWYFRYLEGVADEGLLDLDCPYEDLTAIERERVLYGTGDKLYTLEYEDSYGNDKKYKTTWEGVLNNLNRRYKETTSMGMREEIEKYMTEAPCPSCNGLRLRPESLAVTINGMNIAEFSDMTIYQAKETIDNLVLTEREMIIARQIIKEIQERLTFLVDVGLNYLTLSRSAGTLSGGEAQRIRLATQIGSHLMGVLYILDEPSIGLHQRDNSKLIETLKRLRDLGNTVLVVEHDEETMLSSDYIIDIGPEAGVRGGEVVAFGTPEELQEQWEKSITGAYLAGKKKIEVPTSRRKGNGNVLKLTGAKKNNLQNVNISIPLGTFTCITGVSGSGKSTLINDILYKILANKLNGAREIPKGYKKIEGLEHLDKVIEIDQSPIGRTPRSNPATYTGVFGLIRDLFAQTNEAKMHGYKPGRFSFNVKGGRCEACQGDGIIKIEMHFLPDVYVPCEICKGDRYNRETLEVRYKGKNIADVLNMSIDEATEFFQNQPSIYRKIKVLQDVGLGYVNLGQPATTLSGGEAQRVKLATELSKRPTGKTIYVLDEPTTGLHAEDIQKLLVVLNRLVESGNTVLVIEHNLDVIKCADYIFDLGPEGGDKGGKVIAKGTPELLAKNWEKTGSYTGKYLCAMLAVKS